MDEPTHGQVSFIEIGGLDRAARLACFGRVVG
jgi:hypothetical protein